MTRSARVLVALACALSALGARAENPNPKQELDDARRAGWTAARSAADAMRRTRSLAAWIADFDAVAMKIDASAPPSRWRELDADELLGRNPRFRRAAEAAPSDPALMMAHAALLLAAGEANRSRYVIVLAAQNPQLTQQWRERYHVLFGKAEAAGQRSRALVREGVELRKRRDIPGALEKIAEALVRWPQNANAHREIARTLRDQSWEATRNLDAPDPPEVGAAFERARLHDPLLLEAYQTNDPEVRKRLMALMSTRATAWLRLNQNLDVPVETEMLERLATALERAGLGELALAAGQAARARQADPLR